MWTIVVQSPTGQEVSRTQLRRGVPVTIGRAPDCTITIGALAVSRKHGRIELRNDVPTYFDEEDSAGSRVDGSFARGATPLTEKNVLDVGGFRLTLVKTGEVLNRPKPAPKVAAPAAAGEPEDPMEALFAQKIHGVRSHRDATGTDVAAARAKFEIEWNEIVESARRISRRYGTDPRVQVFTVARDGSDIQVKVKDTSARGYSFFLLSKVHPEGKWPGDVQAWLVETGAPEKAYRSPKEAFEQLLHELAPRLA